MKYKVYSGYLDWSVTVEADSEKEAIEKGRQEIVSRLQEDDGMWAREIPQPPRT